MKYAIYGANRIAKDFIYIFDELNVICVFDDECEIGFPFDLYKTDEIIKKRKSFDKIILCDFDKTEKEKRLIELGLKYADDYLYEEDFFHTLDDIKIPDNKKLIVWGTGNAAERFYDWNKFYDIEYYIDNNPNKEYFMNRKVLHPDDITDWKDYYILIAVVKDTEIKKQLEEYGLKRNKDFVNIQKIVFMPSYMLRRTIFDKSYYDLECNTMRNHLEIFSQGNTRCCCTTFVNENLDNIFEKNIDELWHSNLHKIMCLSTENHTYTFCNKEMCPLFVAKRKEKNKLVNTEYKKMSVKPEVLALGHDATCNLSCVTCRKEIHIAIGDEKRQVDKITEIIKNDYLDSCRFLILAGDGEVFASTAYRKIYESQKCNPEYIRILSNGTLFTPSNWENFAKNKTGKIMLTVSIDAATKKTYEQIRHNGDFEKLQQNMKFASKLKKSGDLKYFRINFVVQKKNYQEMVPFVQWGESLGVDEIFFTKILNWGTYSKEEFAEVSMMEADGITPKAELRKVLENPVIANSKIVDLGTIRYSHKVDVVDKVDNYYMWELEKRGGRLFD